VHPGERYPFKAGQCIHSCHVMGNFFSDLSNSRSSGFLHLMAIFIRYLLRRIAASDSDRPLVSGGGVHAGHVMASTNTGSSCNLQLSSPLRIDRRTLGAHALPLGLPPEDCCARPYVGVLPAPAGRERAAQVI